MVETIDREFLDTMNDHRMADWSESFELNDRSWKLDCVVVENDVSKAFPMMVNVNGHRKYSYWNTDGKWKSAVNTHENSNLI